jgi:hypothetical protein
MGKLSIMSKIKEIVGGIAWPLFLWSIDMKDTEYWNAIYKQGEVCPVKRDDRNEEGGKI